VRRCFLVLMALAILALRATGGLVAKGGPRGVDELLGEGFEDESWRIAWTVVDADGSGSTWTRLCEDQYYEARAGDCSLGCRFNGDGSASDDWLVTPPLRADSLRRSFTIWYRSQDPAYPEDVEFLALHVDVPISAEDMSTRVADFQRLAHVQAAPTEWQSFTHEVDPDEGGLWYFAVRCLSQDRFVLLVDDAASFWALPPMDWVIEPPYLRMDFGLLRQDSLSTRPFRLWNLHADSLLEAVISHRPQAPFVMSTSWVEGATISASPEDTLGALVGAKSLFAVDGDTTRYLGSYADSLVLDLFHHNSGLDQLVIPFTVSIWHPDSVWAGVVHAAFQADSLEDGWSSVVGEGATDSLSWTLEEHVSSANFTVPLRGRFAVVNSDGRGRFTADGRPLVQDAWLLSPWVDARLTPAGEMAGGLLLAWDQVYKPGAGGLLQIVAMAGSDTLGWEPDACLGWESRSLDLSLFAGRDSVRVAFHFQGSWAYGAAVDEVLLLPVAGSLPGSPAEAAPVLPAMDLRLAPNPFNPVTTLHYRAPVAGRLEIDVFNLLGQRVLASAPLLARVGDNAVPLDFSGLASGVYVVQAVVVDGEGRVAREFRRVSFVK
jgi:hypothetical protein